MASEAISVLMAGPSFGFKSQRVYISLRRSMPASPSIPEPNNTMLLGSGVVPLPVMVNDSEGTVPISTSEASDGQPFDLQPTPLFSSQYTISPLVTTPF